MFQNKLRPFIDRYEEINTLLSSPDIASDIKRMSDLSKEQSSIATLVEKAREYIEIAEAIDENKELLGDPELGELAKEELAELEPRLPELEEEIKILMIPSDPNDDKNIYLELRAGAGGDESALFVEDVFKMYLRFAERQGWRVEIVSSSEGTAGGYKEMIALVKGEGVYSKLKYEAGTHRVQRLPETETQGRVHTSAITVAIIPEVDDVEVEIKPSDVKMDVFRASGHGGQSVNTTDSAVRCTHVPTNTVVSCQNERSQHANKDTAMNMLRAKLYEQEMQKRNAASQALEDTKSDIGWGHQIRSYVLGASRIKDLRTNIERSDCDKVLDGDIDEYLEASLKSGL